MKRYVLDPPALHKGAVRAVEIANAQTPPARVDFRVLLRYGVGGKREVEPGAAAYEKGQRMDRHPKAFTAFYQALEEPARHGFSSP